MDLFISEAERPLTRRIAQVNLLARTYFSVFVSRSEKNSEAADGVSILDNEAQNWLNISLSTSLSNRFLDICDIFSLTTNQSID